MQRSSEGFLIKLCPDAGIQAQKLAKFNNFITFQEKIKKKFIPFTKHGYKY